jgi:glycosyltransferase involved in cell wall biosynthesis
VLDSPARRQQLVEAGQARVGTFSWEKTAKQMIEIYRSVASGEQAPRA